MGQLTKREASCYTDHHLRNRRVARPIQGPFLTAQPEIAKIEFVRLPADWAVYEQTDESFFPICTWPQCDEKYSYVDKDGIIRNGSMLASCGQSYELAVFTLLDHLNRKHDKKDVVEPFEPYGIIYEQTTE